MSELPLSKFAPFTKYECHFKKEVSNKLKEIGVQCSNCIYYNEDKRKVVGDTIGGMGYEYDFPVGTVLYHCNILSSDDCFVAPESLCRFFTPVEDVKEVSPNTEEEEPDEELSSTIQKLDFNNSEIESNIINLRNDLINE